MPANWIAFARQDVQAADVLRHNGIYEESCFDPASCSWAGAEGLMQLMPATGYRFGAAEPAPVLGHVEIGFVERQRFDEVGIVGENFPYLL